MYKAQCPNCQTVYKLPADKAGKTIEITCLKTNCRQLFRVSVPMSSEAPGLDDQKQEEPPLVRNAWILVKGNESLGLQPQCFKLELGKNLIGRAARGVEQHKIGEKTRVRIKGKDGRITREEVADRYIGICTDSGSEKEDRSNLSRIHCCIEVKAPTANLENRYLLFDMASAWKVFLNDAEYPLHELDRVYLRHGDQLRLGNIVLSLELEKSSDLTPGVVANKKSRAVDRC